MLWLCRTFELQESTNSRLLAMEGLRGFAVILVFLHHYATQALFLYQPNGFTEAVALAWQTYGNLGVELFFVLSGYLIYGTLISKRPGILRFLQRRAERIYPAFLCAFGIALSLHLAIPSLSKIPPDPLSAATYVAMNLLLLPGLFPIEPLMAVAWSLSYEAFFYLATALLVTTLRLADRSRSVRVIGIAGLAAALIGAAVLGISGVPVRMMPFFAGMLLFEAIDAKRGRVPGFLGLAAPMIAVLITGAYSLPGILAEAIHTVAFFLLCAACFHAGNSAPCFFSWTPLRWLGNMSYSYYLLHGFVVKGAAEITVMLLGSAFPAGQFWSLLLPVFAASLIPPTLLFVLVEKPFSLQLRKSVRAAAAA